MDVWNNLNWFIPQLLLLLFALIMPALDYIFRDKRILAWVALIPLLTIGALTVTWLFAGIWTPPTSGTPLLEINVFSGLFLLVFVAVGIIVVLNSPDFIRKDKNQGEYYALVLLAIIGMSVVAESADLIALFVGLEIAGISSFALSGFRKTEKRSAEAATKYFIVGGFSSALTLFAISLFYGVAGTTNISGIGAVLAGPSSQWIMDSDPVVLLAAVLLLAGLGFKIAMVPFHMWAPDVYEGAPTPVSGLLAAASKKMGFAALFKVFLIGILVTKAQWEEAVAIVAILTMTVGNLIAVSQTNIKRMLAYSSIAQAGYILIALPVATQYAVAGGVFHILTHAFMKSGAFMVVAAMGAVAIGERLDDFKGLSKRSPFLAFSMTLFLLSLAGIPPLAGFASKFVLFSSAVYSSLEPGQSWLIWLAIAGVLNSALSLYYYARVIRNMYMEKGPEEKVRVPPMMCVGIAFAMVMVVLIGAFPDPFVSVCKDAASAFTGLLPGWP
ncbi:MAG: NADH-quinone oxidoreductase subunit N [Candidatus Thermoplasmatota archaeon]|nr:NADH-quinone oxidoreductase subunit N [Candidatus Thermoplasmatota archaeon]